MTGIPEVQPGMWCEFTTESYLTRKDGSELVQNPVFVISKEIDGSNTRRAMFIDQAFRLIQWIEIDWPETPGHRYRERTLFCPTDGLDVEARVLNVRANVSVDASTSSNQQVIKTALQKRDEYLKAWPKIEQLFFKLPKTSTL